MLPAPYNQGYHDLGNLPLRAINGRHIGAVADAVAADGSLRTVVDTVATRFVGAAEWRSWGEDGRSWRSADTPEDVVLVEQLLLS